MAITVVQSETILNPRYSSGSFASPTTAGNCVVVLLFTYMTTNVTMTTTAVTLGGSADNFVQAAAVQSGFANSDTQYIGCWVDPNCAGGQTAIAATLSNGTWVNGAGLILLELAGVAKSTPVDAGFTVTDSATTGTAVTSGTSGATASASEFVIGAAFPDNGLSAESGSFTNLPLGTSPVIASAGYATLATLGSTTSYTATQSSAGVWAALAVALQSTTVISASDTWSGVDTATGGARTVISGADTGSGVDAGTVTLGAHAADTGAGADVAVVSTTGTAAPVLTASYIPAGAATTAVSATQSGTGTFDGMALTVKVVTGQAASFAGASTSSATATTPELSITPTGTGSVVYGAMANSSASGTFTAAANTTFTQNQYWSGDFITFGTFRLTGTTTASTPVTVGATAPTETSGALDIALFEVLAGMGLTLAEDPSSPAVAYTTTATSVATAAFNPPPGSLLVAMVVADCTGTSAQSMTMTVADSGGLTWTRRVTGTLTSGTGTFQVATIWTAVVGSSSAVNWITAGTPKTQSVTASPGNVIVMLGGAASAATVLGVPSGGSSWKAQQASATAGFCGAYGWTSAIPVASTGGTLAVTATSLPAGYVNIAYSAALTASGGSGAGYTWSVSSGSLPAWMTLTAATGVLSGTPSAAGTSNFTAEVTDSAGNTATQALAVTVSAVSSGGGATSGGVQVTSLMLPTGQVSQAYSSALTAIGGTGTGYTWSASGTLPAGLTLNTSTGVVSGTPTAAATPSVTFTVTDSAGNTGSQAMTMTTIAGPAAGVSGSWQLQFADEFNVAYPTPYGTGPNPNVWADHAGFADLGRVNNSGEQEWCPHGFYGHSVAGGIWTSTATFQNPASIDPTCTTPMPNGTDGEFTAGMISGHLGVAFTYGYIEARIQHPSPASSWLGGWMTTRDTIWPPEIDFDEYQPPGHTGQYHTGYDNDSNTWSNDYYSSDTSYHVYGCQLSSSTVTFYKDGAQTFSCAYDGNAYAWAPIFNYAVQSASGGSGYPAKMNVDYVRVWVPEAAPPAPVITSISTPSGIAPSGSMTINFQTVAGATSYRVSSMPADETADNWDNAANGGNPTQRFTASGTTSPLTITGLPSGIRFNFTVCAINGSGTSMESYPAGPQIINIQLITSVLPAATAGVAYSATLTAQAGNPPYTWSVASGTLPAGLTLNTSTGVISGTPTTAETSAFTIKVAGNTSWSGGSTTANAASRALTITVAASTSGTTGGGGGTTTGTGGNDSGGDVTAADWTLVASENFTTNTLSSNFDVYNDGTATSYTANSWMSSQVSVNTTTQELILNAKLSGGSGSERVGGALFWMGTGNAAIMKYGAWECDYYTTNQAGYAPVLLMWPDPDNGTWPEQGEIDIMEVYTGDTFTSCGQSNFHLGTEGSSSHLMAPSSTTDSSSANVSAGSYQTNITEQHTYRLEWLASSITVYIDGTLVSKTTNTEWIPTSTPMRLTMQQEFYGVSDGSITSLNANTVITGLRAYTFNG